MSQLAYFQSIVGMFAIIMSCIAVYMQLILGYICIQLYSIYNILCAIFLRFFKSKGALWMCNVYRYQDLYFSD